MHMVFNMFMPWAIPFSPLSISGSNFMLSCVPWVKRAWGMRLTDFKSAVGPFTSVPPVAPMPSVSGVFALRHNLVQLAEGAGMNVQILRNLTNYTGVIIIFH